MLCCPFPPTPTLFRIRAPLWDCGMACSQFSWFITWKCETQNSQPASQSKISVQIKHLSPHIFTSSALCGQICVSTVLNLRCYGADSYISLYIAAFNEINKIPWLLVNISSKIVNRNWDVISFVVSCSNLITCSRIPSLHLIIIIRMSGFVLWSESIGFASFSMAQVPQGKHLPALLLLWDIRDNPPCEWHFLIDFYSIVANRLL